MPKAVSLQFFEHYCKFCDHLKGILKKRRGKVAYTRGVVTKQLVYITCDAGLFCPIIWPNQSSEAKSLLEKIRRRMEAEE